MPMKGWRLAMLLYLIVVRKMKPNTEQAGRTRALLGWGALVSVGWP